MLDWKATKKEDIRVIEKNEMRVLVKNSPHKKDIGVKWILKIKTNPDGSVSKYKTRLVVKG